MNNCIRIMVLCLFLAANHGFAESVITTITSVELKTAIELKSAPLILDVRTEEEYQSGHIQDALNIPYDQLGDRLAELGIEKSDEVVVYCRSGRRAGIAQALLQAQGYTQVRDLVGHWLEWSAE